MKVGIVSKTAHAKPLKNALSGDGFKVRMLGPDPNRIPPSLDVVVIRTDSCSHGGDKTARNWASKDDNRNYIVANGVGKIRTRLKELRAKLASNAPSESVGGGVSQESVGGGEFRMEDVSKYAQSVIETRGSDSRSSQRDVLRQLLGDKKSLTDRDLDIALDRALQGSGGDSHLFDFPAPFPTEGAWEENPSLKWAKKIRNPERLRAAIVKAQELRDSISDERADAVGERFLVDDENGGGEFLDRNTRRMRVFKETAGFPLIFAALIFLCLPENSTPAKRSFIHAYKALTGKKSDWDKIQAVAWALGRTLGYAGTTKTTEPVEVAKEVAPVVETQVAEVAVAEEVEAVEEVEVETAPAVAPEDPAIRPLHRVLDTRGSLPVSNQEVVETLGAGVGGVVASLIANVHTSEAVKTTPKTEDVVLSEDVVVDVKDSEPVVDSGPSLEAMQAQMEAMQAQMDGFAVFNETVNTVKEVVGALQGLAESFNEITTRLDARLTADETRYGDLAGEVSLLRGEVQTLIEAVQTAPTPVASPSASPAPDMLQKLLDMGAVIQIGGKALPSE